MFRTLWSIRNNFLLQRKVSSAKKSSLQIFWMHELFFVCVMHNVLLEINKWIIDDRAVNRFYVYDVSGLYPLSKLWTLSNVIEKSLRKKFSPNLLKTHNLTSDFTPLYFVCSFQNRSSVFKMSTFGSHLMWASASKRLFIIFKLGKRLAHL